MKDLVFWLGISVLGIVFSWLTLYFFYANYRRFYDRLKTEYTIYLDNRAEKLLTLLHEKLKEFPEHVELSLEQRDSFNRSLGGVFCDFVNMKNDKSKSFSYHYVYKSFLGVLPNSFYERKSGIENGLFEFFNKLDTRRTIGDYDLMIEVIVGDDVDFEEKYEKCHEMIESMYDIPW